MTKNLKKENFFKGKIVQPLLHQLNQGTTPKKMALSLAFGAALAIFPVLGTTTTLCVVVGLILGLNQVALQVMNYICYPFQLILLPVFIRAGEMLYHTPPVPFSIATMKTELFRSPLDFFKHYGKSIGGGISVWALVMPFIIVSLHPLLHRFLKRRFAP